MPPESSQWFYVSGPGARIGPVDFATLQNLLATDALPPSTMVWCEGLPNWIPAVDSQVWPSGKPIPQSQPGAPGADTTGGLIPYNNKDALLSYYIGLFALIPCAGLLMGPAAFVLGRRGLAFARQNPAVKGQAHAWIGIILGGFWSLVHWICAILMAVSLLASGR